MAEGKKSFVLYCDLIEVIEDLSLEQRGQLLTTVLQYVNDLNPNIDEITDKLVKVSFKHIRQDLKRDLEKWRNIVDRNRENGSKGGRPKNNPENPVGILDNPKKPKKPDTDTDTDKDILNEVSHNEIFRTLWNSKIWLEQRAIENKVEIVEVLNHLNRFRIECIGKDDFKVSEKDAKTHFMNWVKRGNPYPEKIGKTNILDTLSSFQNNDF